MSSLDKVEQFARIDALDAVSKGLRGNIYSCRTCGRNYKLSEGANCKKVLCIRKGLCPNCIRICKKCNKVFCPKHIDNHRCK